MHCAYVSFTLTREIWKSYSRQVATRKFAQKRARAAAIFRYFALRGHSETAFVRGMRAACVPLHGERIYSRQRAHASRDTRTRGFTSRSIHSSLGYPG